MGIRKKKTPSPHRRQLGDGRGDQAIPTKVGDGYLSAAVGTDHSCAIKTDGTLHCWGASDRGQLGTPSIEDGLYPSTSTPTWVQTGNFRDWVSISLGSFYGMGIRGANSELYAWGSNSYGQLGLGEDSSGPIVATQTEPVLVSGAVVWDQVSAGSNHACARGNQSELWCWGSTDHGQVGGGFTS